jgi:hypothetical protein
LDKSVLINGRLEVIQDKEGGYRYSIVIPRRGINNMCRFELDTE